MLITQILLYYLVVNGIVILLTETDGMFNVIKLIRDLLPKVINPFKCAYCTSVWVSMGLCLCGWQLSNHLILNLAESIGLGLMSVKVHDELSMLIDNYVINN